MGYSSYWTLTQFTEADAAGYLRALPVLRDVAKRHRTLLVYEHDNSSRRPQVGKHGIHLNGRGQDGHETFYFRLPISMTTGNTPHDEPAIRDFTKTASKPYDMAVSELLLVLWAYMPHLEIDSDGFAGYLDKAEDNPLSALDGSWPEAIENVKRYGIETTVTIAKRRPPYCDLQVEPVLVN